MEKEEYERICELANKLVNGNPCIFTYGWDVPDTFLVDMASLFDANPKTDVLRNVKKVERFDPEEDDFYVDLIVLPNTIERKEIIVKLADYLSGLKISYAFCCCNNINGEYAEYELDTTFLEGGGPVSFGFYYNDESDFLLNLNVLALGAIDTTLTPNPIVESIKSGVHYAEDLYDEDDEKLI